MKNRIASLLLAIAMIASLGVSAMAADQKLVNPTGAAKTYTDVPATYHFYENIQNVTRAGLFQGTTATEFSPYAYMSRGQFVIVLARLDGAAVAGGAAEEGVPTTTSFSDVDANYRFSKAIVWATANSIITGYSDGTFRPRDPISRAQIAALLHRYLDTYKKYNLKDASPIPGQFTDYETTATLADGTTSTACPAVFRTDLDYGRQHGLIAGYSDGSYRPNIPVGRAQVAAMLDRIVLNITTPTPGGRTGGGGGGGGDPLTYEIDLTQEAAGTAITGSGSVTLTLRTGKNGTDGKDRTLSTSVSDTTDEARSLATNTYVNVKSVDPAEGWTLSEFYILAPSAAGNFGKNDKIESKGEGKEVTYKANEEIGLAEGDDFALKTFVSNGTLRLRISFTGGPETPSSDGTYTLTLQSKGTGTYTASVSGDERGAFDIDRTDPATDATWSGLSGSVSLVVDLDDTQVTSADVTNSNGAVSASVTSTGTIGGTTDKPAKLTYSIPVTSNTTVVLDLDALAFNYTITAGGKIGEKINASGATDNLKVPDVDGADKFVTSIKKLNDNIGDEATTQNADSVANYVTDMVKALQDVAGEPLEIKGQDLINRTINDEIQTTVEDKIATYVGALDPDSGMEIPDEARKAVEDAIKSRLGSAAAAATIEWTGGTANAAISTADRQALVQEIQDKVNVQVLDDKGNEADFTVVLTVDPPKDPEAKSVTIGAQVPATHAVVTAPGLDTSIDVRISGTLKYKMTVGGVTNDEAEITLPTQTEKIYVTEKDISQDLTVDARDVPINDVFDSSMVDPLDGYYDKMAAHLDDTAKLDAFYSKSGGGFVQIKTSGPDGANLDSITLNGTPVVTVTGDKVRLDTDPADWNAIYKAGVDVVNELRDAIVDTGSRVSAALTNRKLLDAGGTQGTDAEHIGVASALPLDPSVEDVWKALRNDIGVSKIQITTARVFSLEGTIGGILEDMFGSGEVKGVFGMSRTLAED